MNSGLNKIKPDKRDFSILHSFGALAGDPTLLPDSFSIYDGRPIPDQDSLDTRFTPNIPPLFEGCTGETAAFDSGIQDGKLYNPQWIYQNTPPKDNSGRDIRAALQFLIDNGPEQNGIKRTAYFNVYAAGKIDDFDAARIALWINQNEKRGVWIGSTWFWGAGPPAANLYVPDYSQMSKFPLHCYLCTGWTPDGLEVIPWTGEQAGNVGRYNMSRDIFNNLMKLPWSGSFTITKVSGIQPIPIGYIAIIDHLTAFIRNLFGL